MSWHNDFYPVTKKVFNNYPTTVPSYPVWGDLYLNVDEFQIYRCIGHLTDKRFVKTNYIPDDYIEKLSFYRIADNTFWFKSEYDAYNEVRDVVDAYLIDRYGIKSVTKYIGRKNRDIVVIYQFDDEDELAMFQLFFGGQIIYQK